jgi:SAM-dependent methyltransferase
MSLLTKNLFADSAIFRWLTGRRDRFDLAVAMVGVKLGERLVQIGLAEPLLFVANARKVGISGHACGVDEDAGLVSQAGRTAEQEGVLVETATAPDLPRLTLDGPPFDVAVIAAMGSEAAPERFARAAAAAANVLRPGGRAVVISDAPRGGETGAAGDRFVAALAERGFRGAHILAARDNQMFVEAMKPRTS